MKRKFNYVKALPYLILMILVALVIVFMYILMPEFLVSANTSEYFNVMMPIGDLTFTAGQWYVLFLWSSISYGITFGIWSLWKLLWKKIANCFETIIERGGTRL